MKNHNEMYQSLLSRYNESQEKRNKRIHIIRHTVPVLVCFCLTIILGIGYWDYYKNLHHVPVQPEIIDESVIETPNSTTDVVTNNSTSIQTDNHTNPITTTVYVQSSEAERISSTKTSNTVSSEQYTTSDDNQYNSETSPPPQQTTSDNSETSPPPQQTTIDSSLLSPTETESSTIPTVPGNPMGVLTSLDVSYNEAKELFSQSLVECTDSNFIGYKAGIVSRNGNISSEEAFCLQITYEFTNGTVSIINQDRMVGSRATYGVEQYDYLNRIFMNETFINDEQITIGYYPEGDYGLAYVAVFDRSADIYEIMDMIISIEIRN